MLIGVAGSGRCVGVTHFSILLANYLTGVSAGKTAVLEWNDSGDLGRIQKIYSTRTVTNRQNQTFITYGVSYYNKAGRKELLECQRQGFNTVILDFGVYGDGNEEDFSRCDRKFLLGAFSEWKLEAFTEQISRTRRDCGWEYFSAFGNEETADMIMRCLKVRVNRIPWQPDAFTITGEVMAFFGRFLKYRWDGN